MRRTSFGYFRLDLVEGLGQHGVEPFRGGSGLFRRQEFAQHGDDGALLGQRSDVGRRPLEHGHVGSRSGQRGNERDGRCPAADDDDPLSGEVEYLGPGLRVHDRAGEVLHAVEVGQIPVVVAVVAAAREEEARGQVDGSRRCPSAPR